MTIASHNVLLLYYNPSQAFTQATVGEGVMGQDGVWRTELPQRSPEVTPGEGLGAMPSEAVG